MKTAPKKDGAATFGGRLKQALSAANLKQKDLAAHFDVTEQAVSQWFRGKIPEMAKIFDLASMLRVRAEWLVNGIAPRQEPEADAPREALLIGKVGAGAEIHRFEHPDVLAGFPLPPGLDAPNVAEIDGDSQYPLLPGWLVFYGPENEGVSEKCIGKMCVVQVKDGPALLKILKRGSKKGLWRLESSNAPPREDVKLLWAAMVMDIRPR